MFDVESAFRWYDKLGFPSDERNLDSLVRYAVGELGRQPDQARLVLKDIPPRYSASYLVGALFDPTCRDLAKNLLLGFELKVRSTRPEVLALRDDVTNLLQERGPLHSTVIPLTEELGKRGGVYAAEILMAYGANQITANFVVEALAHPAARPLAEIILDHYGANEYTERAFVRGLSNDSIRPLAQERLSGEPISESMARVMVEYLPSKDHATYVENLIKHFGPCREVTMALANGLKEDYTRADCFRLLREFGPQREVTRSLARVLDQRTSRRYAESLLREWGPIKEVVKALVPLLRSYHRKDSAIKLLREFGPTEMTAKYLVRVLGEPGFDAEAGTLLDEYGLDDAVLGSYLRAVIPERNGINEPLRAFQALAGLSSIGVELSRFAQERDFSQRLERLRAAHPDLVLITTGMLERHSEVQWS